MWGLGHAHSLREKVFEKERELVKGFASATDSANAGGLEHVKGKELATGETAPAMGKWNTMRSAEKYVTAVAQAMNIVRAKALVRVRVTLYVMEPANAKGNVLA